MRLIKILPKNKYAILELDTGEQIKKKLKFIEKAALDAYYAKQLETPPESELERKEAVPEGVCPVCGADKDYEVPDVYETAKGTKGHKIWCSKAEFPMLSESDKETERKLDTEFKKDLEEIEKEFK